MTDLDSRYLTPEQVATDLQLEISGVYKMCKDRRLPAVKIGRSVRIPRVAYERWRAVLEGETELEPVNREKTMIDGETALARFRGEQGTEPEDWLVKRRAGEFGDTAENSRVAIWALALREVADGATVLPEAAVVIGALHLRGR
jgi:excisionase family DNA binding protein